jgi:sugar phosphate isomerase/epimerase
VSTPPLVLYAGCMPGAPWERFVGAAAGAGFDSVTVWPSMYRRAQTREALDAASMRGLLDDAGVRVAAIEACGDWLPDTDAEGVTRPFRSVWTREQFFEAARVLGAPCIVAAHLGLGPIERSASIDSFGQLCGDADQEGLRVVLEFMPFSGIADAEAAWDIVTESGCSNAGLVVDTSHLQRSGGISTLAGVPVAAIELVQLADGSRAAPHDLVDEAMFHRRLPGEGEFELAALLAQLHRAGVSAPVGPELWQADWSERPPDVVAGELASATRRLLPSG